MKILLHCSSLRPLVSLRMKKLKRKPKRVVPQRQRKVPGIPKVVLMIIKGAIMVTMSIQNQ